MTEPDRQHGGFDPSNRKHHDVFISYAQLDKPIADAICAKLESRRIRCWIAPRDVTPAKDFPAAIIEGIDEAEFLVLVFSSHANNSPHVIRELTNAVNKGRIIIPFRIEDVPPSKSMEYLISVPHWLDAITPPFEKHIDELADTIDNLLVANRKTIACLGCGTPLSPQAKFCKSCGAQLPAELQQTGTDRSDQTGVTGMPVKRPAPPSGTGQPKSPPVTRKMIVVAGAVIALLILLVLLRPLLTAGLTNLLAGSETGNLQKMTTPPAPTLPVDYRGEGAFVDSVVLTTEPTQTLAKATDLYIEANKDPTNAEVTVQFTGGGGMGLVKDNTIILTRSDGSVISGKLDFNQKLSEVTLQGTRGTDRLQVIVTMKSGVTYTIIDRLIPYRFRSAT